MHLAAGWSFRHRRTVLTGWPPPYSPAEAGQMNASRTVAFAGLAPVAAAQDAPAAARPPVAGRPRGTARKRRPDPQGLWTAKAAVTPCFSAAPRSRDYQEIEDAWPAHATGPAAHGITWDSGQPGTQDQQAHRREPPQWPPRTTSMPGTAGPWTSKPTGGPQPSAPPARAIAITSIGTGTARIAGRAGPGCSATAMACRTAVSWWTRSSNASA